MSYISAHIWQCTSSLNSKALHHCWHSSVDWAGSQWCPHHGWHEWVPGHTSLLPPGRLSQGKCLWAGRWPLTGEPPSHGPVIKIKVGCSMKKSVFWSAFDFFKSYLIYLMNDTKTCCGSKLCPVCGSSKPLKVFSKTHTHTKKLINKRSQYSISSLNLSSQAMQH